MPTIASALASSPLRHPTNPASATTASAIQSRRSTRVRLALGLDAVIGSSLLMALLELDNVEARYGPIKALHGVSLAVAEGQAVSLLGANGAGKTTTLRAISGTVRKSGDIAFAGKRIGGRAPESVARLGIAHVPEGRGIYSELTVWENVLLGGAMRRGSRAVKRDAESALGHFPRIKDRRKQQAGTLSGGEQQMLALA